MSDDRGATSLEYAMLVAFILIGLAVVLSTFAGDVGTFISAIGHHIAGWVGGLS
jgi:Flp pilus assembly pilin Flp